MKDLQSHFMEQAGYLEVSGKHIYTVLHKVSDPIARVLLVGPFASERQYSYIPWIRWARFLAEQRVEALRFDYRGVGESTGKFEEMTFDDWSEDVEILARWLQTQSPELPLILHGLELGGILASKIFAAGVGSAALFWSAPNSANEVLRTALLHQVAVERAFKDAATRKSASEYVRQLEEGQSLEIEGYQWSGKLWRESFQHQFPAADEDVRRWAGERPVRLVQLDKKAAPLVGTSGLRFVSIVNPDLGDLFADNFNWIGSVLEPRGRSHNEN